MDDAKVTTYANLAFLGLGLMGSRMSRRLLDAGFPLLVWNRSPAAAEPLLDAGARPFLFSDAAASDLIMLCLADDAAVHSVMSQLMPHLRPGQVILDFSSISVHLTRELAAQVVPLGAQWIDAPVSGGVLGAEQGSLVIFAGGDAAQVQSLAPVFAPLAQQVTLMGANGAGQATKLCNQLIVAGTSTLIAEAVALADRAGVDASLLAKALAGGFADSKPLQILAPRMATRTFVPVQWKVHTLVKDLHHAVTLAAAHQLATPVACTALTQLQNQQQNGHATADLSSIILLHHGTTAATAPAGLSVE